MPDRRTCHITEYQQRAADTSKILPNTRPYILAPTFRSYASAWSTASTICSTQSWKAAVCEYVTFLNPSSNAASAVVLPMHTIVAFVPARCFHALTALGLAPAANQIGRANV